MYIDIYPLGYPCPNIGYPCPKYGYPCLNILRISMSEYRLQVGRPPLLLHSTGPRPPDRAIGPVGHSSYTVPGRGFGPARDWTHRSTGSVRVVPVRKTASWAAPTDVAPSRYRATEALARTQSPKHWRVRAVPVRMTSSWAAPAAHWAVAPYQTATGQGHKACGPLYTDIQSAVTVLGGIMIRLTEALARAGRPSQDDFKLGGPQCCSSCTVPGCCHRTGPLGQRSNIQSVTVCGHCPGSLSRAGYDSQNHWRVRAQRPCT